MTITAEAPALAALTDDELAGLFHGADDDQAAAVLAEAQRRDDTSRRRQARRQEPAACAWEEAARAQYAQAERECAGNLIARDAPPWLTDEFSLWRYGNDRYATEELRRWFLDHPRLTLTRYQQQVRDNLEAYAHDLDSDATGSVRLVASADQARQAGSADSTANPVPGPVAGAEASSSSTGHGPAGHRDDVRPGGVMTSSFADVLPMAAEWLWHGILPLAELTLLAGQCGTGKSFTTVDLAARVSRGQAMPDGSAGVPAGDVIMINCEDVAETGVVHRLVAAGADLTRIHDLSEVDGRPFDLITDLPVLAEAIAETGAVLVTIDPLSAASSVALTTGLKARNTVMRPLMALARASGVALVAVHHLVKSGSIAGSQAIVDTPRHVLTVTSDKIGDAKTVTVTKSNIARTGVTARYELAGEWPAIMVNWLPAADDRVMVALSAADSVILALDSADGPMTSRQITAVTGCNYGAVRTACTRLAAAGKIGARDGMFYPVRCNSAGQTVTLAAV